jgi:hypothetical protein
MRKDKLTPETQEKIGAALRASALFDDACALNGVSPRTGYVWLKKGRTSFSGKYFEFARAVDAASAEHIIPIANILKVHATGGVIKQAVRERYTDNHGVERERRKAKLNADGQPEYELIVVDPDPKVA